MSTPSARLCEAAIEAVEASAFQPGTRDGEAVQMEHVVPVPFRLR